MRRIILDTNLLVLLIVGLTDEKLISKHKRARTFVPEDFLLLQLFLQDYQQIVVTPHILAETSNLAAQIGDPDKSKILQTLGLFISVQEEIQHPSKNAVNSLYFARLGLTDSVILEILPEGLPLLTDDLSLYLQAVSAEHQAYNFNHLRQEYL
ncbi:MAG TPA: hypothetical protein VGB77_17830 [Abditibacteriaceae bacterium]|jgi:hypothetical protein